MIPRKLELKNFLCYGEQIQTINFEHYSLICLSGKNGNGKSALLDAMTWALWGQARKITGAAKADEGLIRLGQTRMMVSFEFEMGTTIYRARREFAKTYGKPYAALDFEIFDVQSNKFVSLTDKTIKITQEKIEKTIGLDFETFINSAFLKQGQSNEFSKKTPKERKQIIATILGLAKYEQLQQKALEEVKKQTDEKKLLEKLLEQDIPLLNQEASLNTKLQEEKQALLEVTRKLELLHQEQMHAEEQRKELLDKQKQSQLFAQESLQLQEKKSAQNKQLLTVRSQWQHIHQQMLLVPNMKKLEDEKQVLNKQEKELLTRQQKALSLQEEILKHKELLHKQTNTLTHHHETKLYQLKIDLEKKALALEHLTITIAQLEKEQEKITQQKALFNRNHSEGSKNLAQETTFRTNFEQIKAQFEKRRAFYQNLVQQGNSIKKELAELQQKRNVVDHETSPSCPLCQQMLTVKRKQFLSSQFSKQDKYLVHRLNRISDLVKKLKQLLIDQHEQVQKLIQQADWYSQLHHKQEELTKQLTQINEQLIATEQKQAMTSKQLIDEKKQFSLLEKEVSKQQQLLTTCLQQDSNLQELQKTINTLEEEKKKIVYQQEEYQELQTKLHRIEQTLHALQALPQTLEKQRELRITITHLCNELKNYKQTLALHLQKQAALQFDPVHLTQTEVVIAQLKTSITQESTKKEKLLTLLGSLENELKRVALLKEERKKRLEEISRLEIEAQHYQMLALAFGKNGIQALLIEEAIPEIEEEANSILAQLTNNQSHIFIESLRDLKSGGVKETLDIKIADTAGIRPYELFSGGEAFRIDFALRIAISKLLARRAGTSLQTLIIDEGFGSQDDEGLAHLMNALHTIQHDFSKVIIVSHLAEFKDNFPIHFIVEKQPTGSVIKIEERG